MWRFEANCQMCQQNKHETSLRPTGLLQPLPIMEHVWVDISMDFIGGLPKAIGAENIMVVMDRLSKYSHFIPLLHPFTANAVATSFLKEIVRLHEFPKSIVYHRDRIFISSLWKELLCLSVTRLKFRSAYHPQANGQSEVTKPYH